MIQLPPPPTVQIVQPEPSQSGCNFFDLATISFGPSDTQLKDRFQVSQACRCYDPGEHITVENHRPQDIFKTGNCVPCETGDPQNPIGTAYVEAIYLNPQNKPKYSL